MSLAFFVFLALYIVLPDGAARLLAGVFAALNALTGLVGVALLIFGTILVLTVRLAETDGDA